MAATAYKLKGVEAEQVTELNIADVADWCGGVYNEDSVTIILGLYCASVGDYVVKDALGGFTAWEATDFEAIYEAVV